MVERIVALIRTMRPMTWISVIITVFAGMMISLHQIPPVEDIIFISVLLPIFVLGYANTLNAYTDYRIDEITRPYRAIPQGLIKKEIVLYFAGVLFAGAIAVSVFILDPFPSLFVIAGLVLASAYSMRPTRIKARGPAAPLAIAVGYVFIPFVGAFLLYSTLNYDVLLIAVVLTAQTAGASISKDFIDLEGDNALNVDTLPLTIGLKKAQLLVLSGLAIPVIVFPLLSLFTFLSHSFLLYLVLVPWLLYVRHIAQDEKEYEKAYIHAFFFCAVSILLSGIAYAGGIL
jgi:4-hydroxybenzoate polyprenyltransferase